MDEEDRKARHGFTTQKYEVRKWLLDDPHDVQEVAINLKNKCSEAKSAEVH